MSITVGKLEEMLRKFGKGTEIHTDCGCCNHSAMGDNIISIQDDTDQTYGYISLKVNSTSSPKIKCASNEKEFYEKEIVKLNEIISDLKYKIDNYTDTFDRIKRSIELKDRHWRG